MVEIDWGGIAEIGRELRKRAGGLAAAAAAGMPVLGGLRVAQQEAVRLEQAAVKLALMTPPEHNAAVLAEVERRRKLMGEAAAYESVADDVQAGRWPR